MKEAKEKLLGLNQLLQIVIDQVEPMVREVDKSISAVGRIARQDFESRRNTLRERHQKNLQKIRSDWDD